MKLGAILGMSRGPDGPESIAQQATAYVDQGYSSLWAAHTIGRGIMMPDPLMSLAVAASVTEDVLIGTAVLQVPLYHPIDLAHRIFSLKQAAGDRFVFGVGTGSIETDFRVLDRDHASRVEDFRRLLQDTRTLLETGKLGDRDLTPGSTLLGTPKIYLGSWSKGVRRAAREFDGWIASRLYRSVEQIEVAMLEYTQAGGRAAVVSSIVVNRDTDLGELRNTFARFATMGFEHAVIMRMPDAPPAAAIRKLLP